MHQPEQKVRKYGRPGAPTAKAVQSYTSQQQIFAFKQFARAGDVAATSVEIVAGLRMAGVGLGLVAIPEPTLATKLVGVFLVAKGVQTLAVQSFALTAGVFGDQKLAASLDLVAGVISTPGQAAAVGYGFASIFGDMRVSLEDVVSFSGTISGALTGSRLQKGWSFAKFHLEVPHAEAPEYSNHVPYYFRPNESPAARQPNTPRSNHYPSGGREALGSGFGQRFHESRQDRSPARDGRQGPTNDRGPDRTPSRGPDRVDRPGPSKPDQGSRRREPPDRRTIDNGNGRRLP